MSIAKNKTEMSDKIAIVDFAYAAGKSATSRLSEGEQKRLGQFMTPTRIALVMAEAAVKDIQSDVVKILEPAGGSGVLAAAAVDALISRKNPPSRIEQS